MNPKQLIVKCYAEQEGNCWVAVCLNFNLAAQGDSFEEVKAKLEAMISEYVYDALEGEDKAYAAQLLSRTAPLSSWIKYQLIRLKIAFCHTHEHVFDETMPLRPA
jgi:predicted RNase H-like HicB family nuclease